MSNPEINKNSFSQGNPRAFKNPWVIGVLTLLATVLVVNTTFITMAIITSPGLVDKNYYENSQNFEETLITQRQARAALGWNYQADFPIRPVLNKNELYRISLVDKVGMPLTAATVTVDAYRPSDASADFQTSLIEVGAGMYEGTINYPLKGIWEITVNISRDTDQYDFTRRASIVTQ